MSTRSLLLPLGAALAVAAAPAAAAPALAAAPPTAPAAGAAAAHAALVATASTPSPTVAAAAGCRTGTFAVRVAPRKGRARTVCRPAVAVRGRTPEQLRSRLRAQVRTPRQWRAALPAAARKRFPLARLTKAARALDRAAARRRAGWTVPAATASAPRPTATAAASGGANACNEAPTFEIDPVRSSDGNVTAVTTGGGWVAGSGSTAGRLVVVDADAGNGAGATQTTKDCISWDPCPDANGIVHGTYEFLHKEEYRATVRGSAVRTASLVTVTAKLTARVGDDARVKSFDWDADGRGEHTASATVDGRVRHVPTRITRVHVRIRGVDPRKAGAPFEKPYAVARGNKGAITDQELPVAQALYQLATEVVRSGAAEALLEAESHWYRGKCLTAVFDPAEPEVTPGQRLDVRIAVRAADGSEAQVPLELVPYDGAVGPPTGTAPMTATWTAPQQLDDGPFTAFEVDSTSKRGRLEAYYVVKPARAAPTFRVTFSGDGSYSRHEMGDGLPQVDARHTFAWKSTTAVRFPLFDGLPDGVPMLVNTDATELTGELTGWRTDGGGRRGCSAAPEQANQIGLVRQTRMPDGGFELAITPFTSLVPPGGIQPACDSGAFLFWTKGTKAATTFTVRLAPADLARETIVLDAAPQQPLDPDCHGGEANGDWPCTQSVAWHGTVRLDRIAPLPSR
jgi:hypothetical protein